jgi:hypothetical protein
VTSNRPPYYRFRHQLPCGAYTPTYFVRPEINFGGTRGVYSSPFYIHGQAKSGSKTCNRMMRGRAAAECHGDEEPRPAL